MSEPLQSLLVVQRLSLAFAGVTAVDNLSFIARDGQVTGLIGPPGAGKMSIVNCITGFSRPSSGRLEFHCGKTTFLLERMDRCRIARDARIVRTFRHPRLFTGMTALENILLARDARRSRAGMVLGVFQLGGKRARQAAEHARYWLNKLGIGQAAGQRVADLSPPLRRKVEIARALASGARLVCIDEPENGFDARERDHLLRQLLDAKTEAPAMLITGPDLRFAGVLSDHVVVLDRGTCIAAGSVGEICGDTTVLRTWLGVAPGAETVPRVRLSC
jgi:branched-chain amino acid transport system ATP-binding protein